MPAARLNPQRLDAGTAFDWAPPAKRRGQVPIIKLPWLVAAFNVIGISEHERGISD